MSSGPEAQPPQAHGDEIDSALRSAERLLQLARDSRPQTVNEPVVFEAPEAVPDAGDEYSKAWDIEAAKSIPQTDADIRAKLAKRGLYPPPTADEVEAGERIRLAQLREETSPPERKIQKPPAQRVSARTKPELSPGVRARPANGRPGPSYPKSFE